MKMTLKAAAVVAVIVLSGCNDNCDCCGGAGSAPARQVMNEKSRAPTPAVVPVVAPGKVPQVAGTWVGRWDSIGHKGHGGGLKCEAVESGAQKWAANFIAEFGKTKSYQVKLEGTPGDGAVNFGGKIDLGKEDGGVFTWSGRADEKEFNGKYEGGGDTGTFKMTRAK